MYIPKKGECDDRTFEAFEHYLKFCEVRRQKIKQNIDVPDDSYIHDYVSEEDWKLIHKFYDSIDFLDI